jgi:hypothetical protein
MGITAELVDGVATRDAPPNPVDQTVDGQHTVRVDPIVLGRVVDLDGCGRRAQRGHGAQAT